MLAVRTGGADANDAYATSDQVRHICVKTMENAPMAVSLGRRNRNENRARFERQ
jgi:hypothetical protein